MMYFHYDVLLFLMVTAPVTLLVAAPAIVVVAAPVLLLLSLGGKAGPCRSAKNPGLSPWSRAEPVFTPLVGRPTLGIHVCK